MHSVSAQRSRGPRARCSLWHRVHSRSLTLPSALRAGSRCTTPSCGSTCARAAWSRSSRGCARAQHRQRCARPLAQRSCASRAAEAKSTRRRLVCLRLFARLCSRELAFA
eukprot:284214-Pleurochrysis_carterae.AAC.2